MNTSISAWITFRDCAKAIDFYKSAFGAIETYRLDTPDRGIVAKLSIEGAEFWLSSGAMNNPDQESVGGETIRLILTVKDPYPIFERAIKAGAREIFPVGAGHGWLLGRIVDPFGLHWEIGHALDA